MTRTGHETRNAAPSRTRVVISIMRIFLLIVVTLGSYAVAQAQDLPPGKGLDVMNGACGVCHDTERVSSAAKTREDWVVTVNRMLSKSNAPQVSPADNTILVNYLTKYLGDDVNVNKASAAELESELVITTAEAAAIVDARKANGNLKAWADLEKVAGLDVKSLLPLKSRIKF